MSMPARAPGAQEHSHTQAQQAQASRAAAHPLEDPGLDNRVPQRAALSLHVPRKCRMQFSNLAVDGGAQLGHPDVCERPGKEEGCQEEEREQGLEDRAAGDAAELPGSTHVAPASATTEHGGRAEQSP